METVFQSVNLLLCNGLLWSIFKYPLGIVSILNMTLGMFQILPYWLKQYLLWLLSVGENNLTTYIVTSVCTVFEILNRLGHIILQVYIFMYDFIIVYPLSCITLGSDCIISFFVDTSLFQCPLVFPISLLVGEQLHI